jgi:UDP-galactopyranose mutase
MGVARILWDSATPFSFAAIAAPACLPHQTTWKDAPVPVDIICLSHLRWHFVHQRPQHLMIRAARDRRVLYVEEPSRNEAPMASLTLQNTPSGVLVVQPNVPPGVHPLEVDALQARLLSELAQRMGMESYLVWLYTPMALPLMRELTPAATVYDCMDELSAFRGAPADLPARETQLLRQANLVFTGGQSLFRAKRHLHHNVHCFPSSVDFAHFAAARRPQADPADQAAIPHPRAGFFGVIDERMDLELIAHLADRKPELQLVMVGPLAKISADDLPRRPNLHWLGAKSYNELPSYIAGWDVALLPFAHNDSTRFISPTKVPEYLAAGKPVVSTAIRDVVHPYGVQGLVRIAGQKESFVIAVQDALEEGIQSRLPAIDRALKHMSWDQTWHAMDVLCQQAVELQPGGALVTLPKRIRIPAATSTASVS